MTAPAGRKWASIKEAATYLGLRPAATYRLVYSRQIPAARIGRTWLVDMIALDELLTKQTRTK
jgi:excisionase family DNA binding protein